MVVTLVSNIGTRSESIVVPSAKRTSCLARNSLKNFEITCTPSELAIVKRMMGIEVLAMVNYKHSLIEGITKEPVIEKIGFRPIVPFLVIPD